MQKDEASESSIGSGDVVNKLGSTKKQHKAY